MKVIMDDLYWYGGSGEIDDIISELMTLKSAGATYIKSESSYGDTYYMVLRDETAEEHQARVLIQKIREEEELRRKLERAKQKAEREYQKYLKLKNQFEDKE